MIISKTGYSNYLFMRYPSESAFTRQLGGSSSTLVDPSNPEITHPGDTTCPDEMDESYEETAFIVEILAVSVLMAALATTVLIAALAKPVILMMTSFSYLKTRP